MLSSKPSYMQEYYKKNREAVLRHVNEPVECECKAITARVNTARHKRTNKHLRRLEQQTCIADMYNRK